MYIYIVLSLFQKNETPIIITVIIEPEVIHTERQPQWITLSNKIWNFQSFFAKLWYIDNL